MVTQAAFRDQVREALVNLYDYERLRELPLGGWLRAEPGYAGQRTLRQILLDAIEALRPARGTPVDTPSWRAYHILFYRFVQGMSVGEVAGQLGFGERHLRRHQAHAIETLADLLWRRCSPEAEPAGAPREPAQPEQPDDVNANLAWLLGEPAPQQVELREVLSGVEDLLNRLAAAQGVRFEVEVPPDLPPLSIHPLALRQILVNVLSYAVGQAAQGQVSIDARPAGAVVRLEVRLSPAPARGLAVDREALAISSRLVAMYGGNLQLTAAPAIAVEVPISRRLPVLIVDDNADSATLLTRYLAESRYRPVVARSGQQAMQLAADTAPCAIVLDVMMPTQDGWEVLSLLKAHPATEGIPVIVTTILTDQELALSLGAAGFLHKPVSQTELLAALDQQVG